MLHILISETSTGKHDLRNRRARAKVQRSADEETYVHTRKQKLLKKWRWQKRKNCYRVVLNVEIYTLTSELMILRTPSSIDIPISAGNISSNFLFRNRSLALEQRGLQDSFPTPPVPRRIFSVRDITTVSLTDRDIKNSLTPSYSTLADTFQRVGPAGAGCAV
ncbi:hypothetical protein TNIN_89561 [Trichonephila inaurata madagascariensis]|uniref:Uncharacterized protein n=1 Tax=Trichonephila inaurata madagascariensis TaxID=2747483 RepID=A0A8X6YNM8_9ARAC|nr:hypothetical protein TNIN_89561 [Trichonephila inaurata madagascariensis]